MADGHANKIGQRIRLITADLKRYIEKRLELLVMNIGGQYARWIAEAIQKIAGLVLFLGAVIFLLFALAFYLGDLLNSWSLGFVVAAVPLLVAGYLLFSLKPRIVTRKLRAGFEEELIEIFKADHEQEQESRINIKSQEIIKRKQKEQDG